jgi:hypothetical protein
LCDPAPERGRVDVVDERPLAIDLDDGQPLAVPRLERLVAGDVDLLEPVLSELGDERLARVLAKVAARGVVERYG